MPRHSATLTNWVDHHLSEVTPRSKSLIISVFGDAIAPYAPGVWLGDLIRLMASFGQSERLVRTSAFRLIDESWLTAKRHGRRSFYALTASGARRFESAYEHIYRPPAHEWDGRWTLVALQKNSDPTPERNDLRRDLEWNGFAMLASGVFIHPSVDLKTAHAIVNSNSLADRAIVFRAETLGDAGAENSDSLLLQSWDMNAVLRHYEQFVQRFESLESELTNHAIAPEVAFQMQTLLIHSYRRANLHDPQLPAQLLPRDWPGQRAYEICQNIYQETCRPAHHYVGQIAGLDTSIEAGTRLPMHVSARFGGCLESRPA